MPVVARIGNEADVVAEPRDVDDRLSFRARSCRREAKVTRPSAEVFALCTGDAVSAEQLDRHPADRLARLDRGDENVAGLVGVLLHEQAQVADEDEAAGRCADLMYFFVTGSQPLALMKKRPRSLPPSDGFCRYWEKSKAE